jgi:outer membrane protein OmpU
MKKILLATTLLAATAGAASAEYKLTGYGRIGATYDDSRAVKVQLSSRLRINVDVSATSDTGFEVGARIRLQADQSAGAAGSLAIPSAASFYVTAGAFRLDAGNISDAIDNMATIYNSEIGLGDNSGGDPAIAFIGFDSKPFGLGIGGNPAPYDTANQVGVQASYAAAGFTGRVSYHKADQTVKNGADHIAASVDYKTGALQVGAGYSTFSPAVGASTSDYILSAEYDFGAFKAGALYQDGDTLAKALVTVYGTKAFGSLSVTGYVASGAFKGADTAVGIGANQDLGGGVSLLGSVRHQLNGDNLADVGVKFSF